MFGTYRKALGCSDHNEVCLGSEQIKYWHESCSRTSLQGFGMEFACCLLCAKQLRIIGSAAKVARAFVVKGYTDAAIRLHVGM